MNSFELGKVAPVAFLTVAALGACSTGAEIPLRTDMRTADVVPETRFDYEYGGGRYTLPNYGSRVPSPTTRGQDCLWQTAYDTFIYRDSVAEPNPNLITTFANGVLTLTPLQADSRLPGASLRVTGFDNPNRYLRPVGSDSKAIFKARGCDLDKQTDVRG